MNRNNWKYQKLKEIAISMYRGSGIKRDQITISGMPCIRYGEIYTTYNISFDLCVSYTQESSILNPKYFEHGDILFAITGESVEDIGKSIAYLGNERCLLGGDIVAMKHKQNPKYLAYALSSPNAITQKGLGKTKLKVVHTNIPSLEEIIIPVPPLAEQQEIVDYLDKAFAKIDALKKNAEQQLSDAKALFSAALEESMTPQKGWEEKILGDICSKITDGSHNPPKGISHSDYIMLSSRNVQNGYITTDSVRYLTKEEFENEEIRTNIEKGDVLLTIVGTIGRTCVITDNHKYAFQRSVAVLKPSKLIGSFFLMYELLSLNEYLNKEAQGAAQKGIYLKQLGKIPISYPSLPEQQAIVAHLDALSSKVNQLQENYNKILRECDALKQALLREIFEQ